MEDEWFKFFTGAALIITITIVVLIFLFNLNQAKEEGILGKPNETINTEDIGKDLDKFSESNTLHWTHMPITYTINSSCGEFESLRLKKAMEKITSSSPQVSFKEVTASADLEITCSYLDWCYNSESQEICPHETSNTALTKANPNMIVHARIEMVGLGGFLESGKGTISGFSVGECGPLNKEVHAILRAFGYESSDDPSSIMYRFEEFSQGASLGNQACEIKKIDSKISSEISKTYSTN
jgi:hypothetical protein